jgi:hypothetical protein
MLNWARKLSVVRNAEPQKPQTDWRKLFRERYFADIPVDLENLGEIRAEKFPRSGPDCWLDAPNALIEIERRAASGELSAEDAAMAEHWTMEGYHIAPKLIGDDLIDKVWAAYEAALASGAVSPPPEVHGPGDVLPSRLLDPHIPIPVVRELQQHPEIMRICDLLLGRRALPFQTIIGHKGSWQPAHDDSIHMTTYPDGYLIACWIALEDIHPDSGPLEYYPRSHRLVPPLLSRDVGIGEMEYKNDPMVYRRVYEKTIAKYIAKLGLKPSHFMAKKGDVLFWHAHLLHGGSARTDLTLTRKALVCHYFAEGSFAYHDLAGSPTRLSRDGLYAAPAVDLKLS